jgi:hypothetical protein
MTALTGPIARIILRYLSGALVAIGLLLPGDAIEINADPEILSAVMMLVGTVVGVAVETAYALAKRMGWRT